MQEKRYRYLYGPVPSRRLGLSLGVDLVPMKTCSYNCIYCQLGRTEETTVERREYVPSDAVMAEIGSWIERDIPADYITMSGSGEPTLNSTIGEIIQRIKEITDIPVAVITNGSLLSDGEVRDACAAADLVVPSLDAGSPSVFRHINRPDPRVTYEEMVSGLIDFSEMYAGELWVEVFLVYPANTLERDLMDLKRVLDRITYTRIHLNTCVRPPAESFADEAPPEKIELALDIFGEKAEGVLPFERETSKHISDTVTETQIMNLLKRRPCSLQDMASSFQTSPNEVLKYLDPLVAGGKVAVQDKERQRFYTID